MDLFIYILLSALTLYLLFALYLFCFQEKQVYKPSREMKPDVDELGFVYDEIFIGENKEVCAWYFSLEGDAADNRPVVLFCHGNAGNISTRHETVKIYRKLNVNLLLFDYRGYGKSKGSPGEPGTYQDTMAAYQYLVNERKVASARIIIHGRSLGGPMASELARKVESGGVILESTFTSIPAMAAHLHPHLPIHKFTRIKYPTVSYAAEISCRALVVHSKEDLYIPFVMGEEIYASVSCKKEFLEIMGGHFDGYVESKEVYVNGLKKFIG